MKKTEITFVRDMDSPKISSMLMSDITFVNFEKRRYINEIPINVQDLISCIRKVTEPLIRQLQIQSCGLIAL